MILGLSLIAVVYIGLVALVQGRYEKTSRLFIHCPYGLVTLGFFMFSAPVLKASVQMVSHGFIAGAMFYCIGVMYDRVHSRQIADYGGVVNTMPKFGRLFHAVCHGECRFASYLRFCRRIHGHFGGRQAISAAFAALPRR